MKSAMLHPTFVQDFLEMLPKGTYGHIPIEVDDAFDREMKRGKFKDWNKEEIRRHLRLQQKTIRQILRSWS